MKLVIHQNEAHFMGFQTTSISWFYAYPFTSFEQKETTFDGLSKF